MIPEAYQKKLRPHQVEPASELYRLCRNNPEALAVVDASDTGVGKTYVGAAVVLALNEPTLAVVPKIAIPSWERALAHFGGSISLVSYETLRTGRSPYGCWENTPPPGFKNDTFFKCQSCQRIVDFDNFEPCYCHPIGVHCLEEKKKKWKYGKFIFDRRVRRVLFDEAHRCSAPDSLNARMLTATRRAGIPSLCLSATLGDTPMKFDALGFALGLHAGGGSFYNWTRKFGCSSLPGMKGWHWLDGKDKQKESMKRLHNLIIPARGIRIKTRDIPNFPKRTVTAELYELEESGKIDALYAEMSVALEALQKQRERDVASDHPLTMQLRIRQKLELLKVPLAVELRNDALEKGLSVGIFINFKQTMDELRRRLKCDCFIDGSPEGVRYRERNIQKFQSDDERTILVNSDAGGIAVSLQDLRGEFPRQGYVMPCLSATTFTQLLGRFQREGALTPCFYKVLLAAHTAEEKIYAKLSNKLANLTALLDGATITDDDFLPYA